MTTKEKIIRESIEKVKEELAEIISIIDATPLSGIIAGRKEAVDLITPATLGDEDAIKRIGELAEQEKRLFKIAEKQKNTSRLIGRRIELDSELTDLENELYYIERNK